MPAKHIQVARDSGMDDGLTAFMSAPSSKLSPNHAKIVGNGRRSRATMLKQYCSIFSDQVGRTRPSKQADPVLTERVIDDKQALLERIAETLGIDTGALNALVIGESVEEESTDEDALVLSDLFVTVDAAWALLGASIDRPSEDRRGQAASNGQMWRINSDGLLSAEEVARLNALAQS